MRLTQSFFISLVIVCVFSITIHAQGGGREPATPTQPRNPPKSVPVPKPPPVPKSATVGQLVIRTKPADCSISLDGKAVGASNQEGILTLSAIKPGEHILIVRKPTYNEEKRTIQVYAGRSDVQEIFLSAMPGKITVISNIIGAQIQIPGVGEYQSPITDLPISPGRHQVNVSKPGYRTATREIDIKPSQPVNISVTLEPLSATEMLAQAEGDFRGRRYTEVIATCRTILTTQPDQPRANYLIGMSYYNADKYMDSVPHLIKAISGGEQVNLPIKHHHRAGLVDDDLCSGTLIFRKGTFEFHADISSGHDFSVPFNKIYESKNEWQKAGRLHVKISMQKGNKEDKKTYNFHVIAAELRSDGKITSVICYSPSCKPMVEFLYQLLQQLKQ
jgi:PEGA domain